MTGGLLCRQAQTGSGSGLVTGSLRLQHRTTWVCHSRPTPSVV